MQTLKVKGREVEYIVTKIFCLGRNYLEHAREMKAEVPTIPVVFLKPPSAILQPGGSIVIPSFSHDMHHEVELVVLVGEGGKDIPHQGAMKHVAGYAVGLDMTLRDVQAEAKKKGLPWTVAKGFDTSAPISEFIASSHVPDPHACNISLRVNGGVRQESNTRNMIFRVPDIIAYLSTVFTLEPGDLIFMGTPEGVGPVQAGDLLEAEIEGIGALSVRVAPTPAV
jgi:2-keto-4-pentenoate hydratase/2-oxohepta-3-ene-1,7-dioic acid hydratase in catechol pathway